MPTPKRGQATIEIAASPADIYALIADITRMGEWSPECHQCEWVGEGRLPVVGARFRGHNRMGPIRWTTTCEIVAADPGREFAFTVIHDGTGRESTRWRYRLEVVGATTMVTESFEFVWCPVTSRIGDLFLPRARVLRRGVHETLERIKVAAESPSPRADPAQDSGERIAHWDSVYKGTRADGVSWYQTEPVMSLEIVKHLGVPANAAVIDVGAGASNLVDALLQQGFTDVTVLDISESALQTSRERVGADAPIQWIAHDLLMWEPTRHYDLWHDRAVFHFLSPDEVVVYLDLLHRAVATAGYVVMATFALDGPEWCSGLPVTRYDADQLIEALGDAFTLVDQRREIHTTPTGAIQPFTWVAARRISD